MNITTATCACACIVVARSNAHTHTFNICSLAPPPLGAVDCVKLQGARRRKLILFKYYTHSGKRTSEICVCVCVCLLCGIVEPLAGAHTHTNRRCENELATLCGPAAHSHAHRTGAVAQPIIAAEPVSNTRSIMIIAPAADERNARTSGGPVAGGRCRFGWAKSLESCVAFVYRLLCPVQVRQTGGCSSLFRCEPSYTLTRAAQVREIVQFTQVDCFTHAR